MIVGKVHSTFNMTQIVKVYRHLKMDSNCMHQLLFSFTIHSVDCLTNDFNVLCSNCHRLFSKREKALSVS